MFGVKAGRLLGRAVYALGFVVVFASIGKCCQYAGVALFSDRLGFEAGSAIGLSPFVMLLAFGKVQYPRWFTWRRA